MRFVGSGVVQFSIIPPRLLPLSPFLTPSANIWIIPFMSQAPSTPNLRTIALAVGPSHPQVFVQLPPFSERPERKNGAPRLAVPHAIFPHGIYFNGKGSDFTSFNLLSGKGWALLLSGACGRVQPWQVPIREWMRLGHVQEPAESQLAPLGST